MDTIDKVCAQPLYHWLATRREEKMIMVCYWWWWKIRRWWWWWWWWGCWLIGPKSAEWTNFDCREAVVTIGWRDNWKMGLRSVWKECNWWQRRCFVIVKRWVGMGLDGYGEFEFEWWGKSCADHCGVRGLGAQKWRKLWWWCGGIV